MRHPLSAPEWGTIGTTPDRCANTGSSGASPSTDGTGRTR